MAPDLSSPSNAALPLSSESRLRENSPPHPEEALRRKFRIRFRKIGDLRLVSHHDLMHVFERMFRRADLPIPVSQGFNPRPRMWFALSLALGVAGMNEILEIEVAQMLEPDAFADRLVRQCPIGIEILSVRVIDLRASGRVRRAWYRLAFSVSQTAEIVKRCQEFLTRSECWVERARPHPRRVNVRPFVDVLRPQDDQLTMALWITPTGAARPEEVIAALDLRKLLDTGAVIERTDLEVYDELPPGTADAPLIQGALQEIATNDQSATVEAPRPTPIMDSPLSFET